MFFRIFHYILTYIAPKTEQMLGKGTTVFLSAKFLEEIFLRKMSIGLLDCSFRLYFPVFVVDKAVYQPDFHR
jgi:hypothetical protein